MRWLILAMLVGSILGSVVADPAPKPKVAPTLPCHEPHFIGPWDAELFAGCTAMPFNQAYASCPRGTCPKPCKIEREARSCCPHAPTLATQTITYDTDGRWVGSLSSGSMLNSLRDYACTYRDGKLDTCRSYLDGNVDRTLSATRTVGMLEIENPDGGKSSYARRGGRTTAITEGREGTDLTYDTAGRLVKTLWMYKSERRATTYRYNAAGSVIEERTEGRVTSYAYDARGRLSKVTEKHGDKTQTYLNTYDEQDRLIEQRSEGAGEGDLQILRYHYRCP